MCLLSDIILIQINFINLGFVFYLNVSLFLHLHCQQYRSLSRLLLWFFPASDHCCWRPSFHSDVNEGSLTTHRELSDEQATAELPPEERHLRAGVKSAAPVADRRGGSPQRQMQLCSQGDSPHSSSHKSITGQHFTDAQWMLGWP